MLHMHCVASLPCCESVPVMCVLNECGVGAGVLMCTYVCVYPLPPLREEKVRNLQAELEEEQEKLINGEWLPNSGSGCRLAHVVHAGLCILTRITPDILSMR